MKITPLQRAVAVLGLVVLGFSLIFPSEAAALLENVGVRGEYAEWLALGVGIALWVIVAVLVFLDRRMRRFRHEYPGFRDPLNG
jgi:hypothetical protein